MDRRTFFAIFACILVSRTNSLFSWSWSKAPTERVTSIALDKVADKLYMSYIDLSKESKPNSYVKTIGTGANDDRKIQFLDVPADLISPISIEIDSCNNLWILDCGVQNISGTQVKTGHPNVVSFSVNVPPKSNAIQYEIPEKSITQQSFFASMALDITDIDCKDAIIYIADFTRPALVRFRTKNNSSKVFQHHYFNPHPQALIPNEMIFNKEQKTKGGIFGMVKTEDKLFYHPLASFNEFSIDLHLIRTEDAVLNYKDTVTAFDRPNPAGSSVFDAKNNVIFFAAFKTIGCYSIINGTYRNVTWSPSKDSSYVTDLAVNSTSLWVLLNSDHEFEIVELNIAQIIAGINFSDKNVEHLENRSGPLDSPPVPSPSSTSIPSPAPTYSSAGRAPPTMYVTLVALLVFWYVFG